MTDEYRYRNNMATLRAGIDGFLLGVATSLFVMLLAYEASIRPVLVGSVILTASLFADLLVVWFSQSTPFGR